MPLFSYLRRSAILGRQRWPAMPLAVGVVSSQLVGWFIPSSGLLSGLVVIGVLCLSASCLIPGMVRMLGRHSIVRRDNRPIFAAFVRIVTTRVGGLLGGVIFGLVSCACWHLHDRSVQEDADATFLVEVMEAPRRPVPGAVSFYARMRGGGSGILKCRAVELPWRNAEGLRQGDVAWVRGKVTPLVRPRNPFSWEAYLYRRGVAGEMRITYMSDPLARSLSHSESLREKMRRAVSLDGELTRGGALFLSMAFGFHDVLSSRVEDAFKVLGLSHILVVSGYQVSLVFGVVTSVCGALQRLLPILGALRHLGGALGIIVAVLYVAIIGFEMSATRALIAASCVCAGLLMDRSGGFGQRWWVAFLLMNVIFPWACYELGAILTFAALAGIGVGASLGQSRIVGTWMWVHLCVWVFTSFVLMLASGAISVISLILNLLIPAPWSVLNCTVGIIGLVGVLAGIPGGKQLLAAVGQINEHVAAFLVTVRDACRGSIECEGLMVLAAAVGLGALAICIIIRAARAPQAVSGYLAR